MFFIKYVLNLNAHPGQLKLQVPTKGMLMNAYITGTVVVI